MNLNNVTICSIDCLHPNLAVNSLKKSIQDIEFADCILFTDKEINHDKIKTVAIDPITHMDHYDTFVFKELHKHIKTDFVLIVQWDGWILDSTMWNEDYQNYDYIGAPWSFYDDGHVVGNGGFSFRSKKLLEVLTNDEFKVVSNQAEDDAICRSYRNNLEQKYNIKFAPVDLAEKFSYESYIPHQSTFGFHGIYNLWRHADDEEIVTMFKTIGAISKDKISQQSFFSVLLSYFNLRKFAVLKQLYNVMRDIHGVNMIGDGVFQITKDKDYTINFIRVCESL